MEPIITGRPEDSDSPSKIGGDYKSGVVRCTFEEFTSADDIWYRCVYCGIVYGPYEKRTAIFSPCMPNSAYVRRSNSILLRKYGEELRPLTTNRECTHMGDAKYGRDGKISEVKAACSMTTEYHPVYTCEKHGKCLPTLMLTKKAARKWKVREESKMYKACDICQDFKSRYEDGQEVPHIPLLKKNEEKTDQDTL